MTGPIQAVAVAPEGIKKVTNVDQLDPQVAFGVFPLGNGLKPAGLARTLDGGRSWTGWRLPDAYEPNSMAVYALNDETAIIDNLITRDGGRTWAVLKSGWGSPIATVPAGWRLYSGSAGYSASPVIMGGREQLAAIDPATGVIHPLSHHLGLVGYRISEATDGSLWLLGQRDYPAHGYVVNVSHDRGMTWSAFEPKSPPPNTNGLNVSSFDGRTGYLLSTAAGPNKSTLGYLYTTHDGGKSWSAARQVPLSAAGGVEALPDGGMLVVNLLSPDTGGPVMTSKDGGQTFQTVPGLTYTTAISRLLGGGWQANAAHFQSTWMASADGIHYTPLLLP
ncbi:hypothetical protein GCM10009765_16900 [Fodinicola feengrottensis]|uniref:Exo-alpha-sialidase n=1 Tax=Fodinicola feengrottensis TaxID=435914 RepID=A0ABN2GB54_9ACTN